MTEGNHQMSHAVRRALAVTAGVSLLILVAGSAQAQAAKSTKKANARPALASLISQTSRLPRQAASSAAKARLLRRARHARSVASKSPCMAVRDLTSYRKALKSTKIRPSAKGRRNRARLRQRLAALAPASVKASRKLLSDRRTRSCGGGIGVPKNKAAQTSVLRSDVNGMTVRVKLPELRFVPEEGGGKQWTKLVLPNTDS